MNDVVVWKDLNGNLWFDNVNNLYTPEYRAWEGDHFNPEREAKQDFGHDFVSVTDVQHAEAWGAKRVNFDKPRYELGHVLGMAFELLKPDITNQVVAGYRWQLISLRQEIAKHLLKMGYAIPGSVFYAECIDVANEPHPREK